MADARRKMLLLGCHPPNGGTSVPSLADYVGTMFLDQFTGGALAAGNVNGTTSSDGKAKRIVTDTNSAVTVNAAAYLAIADAGGGDGDPGVWWSDTLDAEWTLGVGIGPFHDLDNLNDSLVNSGEWGLDVAAAGDPAKSPQYGFRGSSEYIRAFDGGNDGPRFTHLRATNENERLLGVYRAQDITNTDNYLRFYWLKHVSGTSWRLISPWISPATRTIDATSFVSISVPSSAVKLNQVGLIDLSSDVRFAGDFTEMTDNETNPATGTAFDCEANCHVSGTVTVENTKYVYIYIRYTNVNNWVRLAIGTDRVLKLEKNVATSVTTVATGSTLVDATPYQFDIVANGTTVEAFIDCVLDVTGTIADHVSAAQGRAENDLASNDIVLTSHPYPKLGLATDRIVCPQDQAFLAFQNCISSNDGYRMEIRNIQGTSVSYIPSLYYDWDNVSGAGTNIRTNLATGNIRVYDGPNSLRMTALAACSVGDDISLIHHGSNAELFVNGVSVKSSAAMATGTGTAWNWDGNSGVLFCDSCQAFPLFVDMPFTL